MITERIPLAPLLDWLSGETLYSLCSRFHVLSGHATPDRTCTALFKNRRSSTAHDIPSHVSTISEIFDGHLGSASDIVLQHSLLPFYFPYHPKNRCLNWLNQVLLGNAQLLKAELGLAPSRFGAAHPLKACPSCMSGDLSQFGTAYWHVAHQLPGVVICPAHRCPLHAASDKVTGRDRFAWILPMQARLDSLLSPLEVGPLELQLSDLSVGLWNLSIEFEFNLTRLSLLYRQKMIELDLFDNKTQKVNSHGFTDRLDSMLWGSGIASIWPWLSGPKNAATAAGRLLRFVRVHGARDSRHPLSHALLQILLFGSWSAFWTAYEHTDLDEHSSPCKSHSHPGTYDESAASAKTQLHRPVLQALQAGHSITQVAKTNGIAIGTAKAWAAQEGIATPVRPKILKPDLRKTLIGKLSRGMEKTEAASAVGISVVTVTRVLSTEPGLHDLWSDSRRTKAQLRARSAWTAAMKALPAASSNHWRALDPAAYGWLYRNDRVWLQASIRDRKQPARQPKFRRNWRQRDDVLAQAVLTAALDFVKAHANKRLTLGELCSNVKGLREVQSALSKLPRTAAAIQQVCSALRLAIFKRQRTFDGPLFES